MNFFRIEVKIINKHSKNLRTLEIYSRLCEGKIINKAEEAERYGVDERSIQRDIDDIRTFLSDITALDTKDDRNIVYDRVKKGFVMAGGKSLNILVRQSRLSSID